MSATNYDNQLAEWIIKEKAATKLTNIVSKLRFENSTELVLFRNKLVDQNISEVLNLHIYAREFVKQNITIKETLPIAQAILNAGVTSAKIDLGKLTSDFMQEGGENIESFIAEKLGEFINNNVSLEPKDVILYGFGRIGRLVARELIAQEGSGNQLRLRAIVTRNNRESDIIKRASLLRTDSVHGKFPGSVLEDVANNCLIINGRSVHMIASKSLIRSTILLMESKMH